LCGLAVVALVITGTRDPLIIIAVLVVATAIPLLLIATMASHRPKPEGYVGKFRRPDGSVVHVARLGDARLTVVSDTQPPEDLGNVDGRELTRWQKLATEPDG
jgi:hypothetical protein